MPRWLSPLLGRRFPFCPSVDPCLTTPMCSRAAGRSGPPFPPASPDPPINLPQRNRWSRLLCAIFAFLPHLCTDTCSLAPLPGCYILLRMFSPEMKVRLLWAQARGSGRTWRPPPKGEGHPLILVGGTALSVGKRRFPELAPHCRTLPSTLTRLSHFPVPPSPPWVSLQPLSLS